MPSAPRKYTDHTRTQIRPEWLQWREDDVKEQTLDFAEQTGQDPARYFPEDYGKDLGDGTWIFVVDPPTSVDHAFDVPLLSMWWARPTRLNRGGINGVRPYQAVITTPAGDLHLWPHEYAISSAPEKLIGEEGAHIHTLGGDPLIDPEKLWYLQSRGIPQHEATLMLFGQIQSQNFAYVTFDDDIVDMFAGVGTIIGSAAAERWFAKRDADADVDAA